MAKRGPKPGKPTKTVGQFIRMERAIAPTYTLTAAARREFDRLVSVLRAKGVLALVDMAAIADLARMADLLNEAVKAGDARTIGSYQAHVRGLRRELGLTRQPSRTITRVNPGADAAAGAGYGRWSTYLGSDNEQVG
jgi:hypothetical protein